jgi:hypothetical protein
MLRIKESGPQGNDVAARGQVNMSEANRMFVESVIKRCLADRGGGDDGGPAPAPAPALAGGSKGGTGGKGSAELQELLLMNWSRSVVGRARAPRLISVRTV